MDERGNILKNSDFIVSAVFLLLCALMAWQIPQIRKAEARLMPIIILVITFASSAGLMAASFRENTSGPVIRISGKEGAALGVLAATYLLMYLFGLLPAIFCMLTALGVLARGKPGARQIIFMLIFNAVFILILYVGFIVLLGMYMSSGILFD
jgi:hypothetical protein